MPHIGCNLLKAIAEIKPWKARGATLKHCYEGCYRAVCSKDKGLRFEGQTGVTGTNPTQCHRNGMVLSI